MYCKTQRHDQIMGNDVSCNLVTKFKNDCDHDQITIKRSRNWIALGREDSVIHFVGWISHGVYVPDHQNEVYSLEGKIRSKTITWTENRLSLCTTFSILDIIAVVAMPLPCNTLCYL